MKKLIQDIIEGRPADDLEAAAYYDSAMKQLYDAVEHRKPEPAREHGDCAKLPKTVDLRFDICRDIALVLKIGRDYQNKDGYRGAHYDTVKLLCDAIEYQQEQLKTKTEVGDAAKLREALSAALEQVNKVYDILSRPCVCIEEARQGCREARGVLIPALSALPRNCDVGSVDEQIARFDAECLAIRKRNTVEPCAGCLCSRGGEGTEDCQLRWAQMPYEEGGKDGSK